MEHLRAIAPDIRLDVDKMMSDKQSAYAIAYLDPQFAYLNNRHCTDKLSLIGWLLCTHWSQESQNLELWHLVNPEIREAINKDIICHVLNEILYVALTINQRIV